MAIYHLHGKIFTRTKGHNAVAKAAYRSGEKLYDEREGTSKSYAHRHDVLETHILAPDNAPEWARDRAKLWNAVEAHADQSTRRKKAQLAREYEMSLPKELSFDQRRDLALGFVQKEFVDRGMVADVCFHEPDKKEPNPHIHVMLTMSYIDEDGFGKKGREWNATDLHNHWREAWEEHVNEALREAGREERIDHRSLEEQGIDREPTQHMGPHRHMTQREMENDMEAIFEREEIIAELEKLEMEKAELESMMAQEKQYENETKEEYVERILAEAKQRMYEQTEENDQSIENELEDDGPVLEL